MDPRIIPITDDLFFIQRGWLNGNHLVFTGKPRTLVDTAYIRDAAETESLIAQCGLAIEDVELIVNTHAHCDHIGGNAEFQRRSGCQVALHQVDRYFVDQRNDWATWWGYYQQDAAFFPTHHSLTDGEVLTLGQMNWLVLHTPGHGMGQIALYCMDTGWLVSADTVWDGDFGVLTTRIEGLDAPFRLRESLERLGRLRVQAIYPGHGAPLADGPAAIEACLARVAAFLEDPRRMGRDQVRKILLYTLMMRGPLHREGLWQLGSASPWFPETTELYFGGKLEATFRDNLDYLLEQGLVKDDGEGRLVCTLSA
ncbi:MAG: MBL fold metallo-hydrolase [Proteobacteria bacterium]|nr:MBL fold metallo-hydrolase [Pseudomonadota bacterium]MBU1450122.1 MBL fold metallo-hydrolase [Pseudomonadota bacterium]MBU2468335.1 MBL fold metallo-hydrolase [Pseudomonadota bacterium]MBU2515978.1 MBL fold metallo-hydrolase [Pseudomonadota bacterium]